MGGLSNERMMFIDTTKCIGCKACQVACKQWHSLPAETDSGTVTAGSTSTTLVDNTKSWAIDQWVGRGVQILAGTGAGQKRTIVSNTYQDPNLPLGTTNTLTVSSAWSLTPDTSSTYAISTIFNGSYTNPPDYSGSTLTYVQFTEIAKTDVRPTFLFFKNQCRHCFRPKCQRVCPAGVERTKEGFVIFNENCRPDNLKRTKRIKVGGVWTLVTDLAQACPYDVPRYNTLLDRYVKCDFCFNMYASNGHTACELTCPAGAIKIGTFDEIRGPKVTGDLTKGIVRRRYQAVKLDYPNACVYQGKYGRTNVIYLLTEKPSVYGL